MPDCNHNIEGFSDPLMPMPLVRYDIDRGHVRRSARCLSCGEELLSEEFELYGLHRTVYSIVEDTGGVIIQSEKVGEVAVPWDIWGEIVADASALDVMMVTRGLRKTDPPYLPGGSSAYVIAIAAGILISSPRRLSEIFDRTEEGT